MTKTQYNKVALAATQAKVAISEIPSGINRVQAKVGNKVTQIKQLPLLQLHLKC